MWPRILLAGFLGGLLMFVMGAISHMVFQLQDRTMLRLPDEAAFIDQVKAHQLKHGIYAFPRMPADTKKEDESKAYEELNARYKAGPAGWLIIHPTGEDMMGPHQLVSEPVTNIVAALFAAWIVSLFAADVGFSRRVAAIIVIGFIGWASISASHAIWYRFSHEFTHDELFCTLLEWSVAALPIAAIVRRPPATHTKPATSP
jgi:hypothetical protein